MGLIKKKNTLNFVPSNHSSLFICQLKTILYLLSWFFLRESNGIEETLLTKLIILTATVSNSHNYANLDARVM